MKTLKITSQQMQLLKEIGIAQAKIRALQEELDAVWDNHGRLQHELDHTHQDGVNFSWNLFAEQQTHFCIPGWSVVVDKDNPNNHPFEVIPFVMAEAAE